MTWKQLGHILVFVQEEEAEAEEEEETLAARASAFQLAPL
jgi:hypothetical protein